MTRLARTLVLAAALVLAALALSAYRPFTNVTNVCPSCPERGDKITLAKGDVLVARVLARNEDGWIVQKNGELRLILIGEVQKVQFEGGSEPKSLGEWDQIVVKNPSQTVLHGTIVSMEPGKTITLRGTRGQLFEVSPKLVQTLYRKGQKTPVQ